MKRISVHLPLLFALGVTTAILTSGCGGGGSSSPPAPVKPAAMAGVSAIAGDGQVTISWNATVGAISYSIYRADTAGQTGSQISSVNSPSASFVDSGVSNGVTYYYIVKAVGGTGVISATSQVSATPASGTPSSVTISGKVEYQDKEYSTGGFTGNQPYKAVRYASIDLVSAANSTPLYSTSTDSNGFFSITTSPTTTVYLRINAEAILSGGNPQAEVKDLSGNIYAIASNDFLLSGSGNVNVSIPASLIAGAYNIMDVMINGMQLVYSLSGSYPSNVLSVYWGANNCTGTFFDGLSDIYVLNDPSGACNIAHQPDTDEYDDDVLYHEFGHFIASQLSKDDSPGGQHALTSNDLDMRLAWSEGWGDSMPGNVKLWLDASGHANLLSSAAGVPLTEYIDTIPGNVGIAFDMGNPGGSPFYYATGEIAVAKILLDLNKDFGMSDVWSVLTDFKSNPPATPVNLELFWDRWLLSQPTTTASGSISIGSIFTNRAIVYTAEADSSVPSAATYTPNVTGAQVHYLYPDGDADYAVFSATAGVHYTIKTSNLLNGADTFLTLLNADGITQTAVSGNPNDNTNNVTYTGTSLPSGVCDSNGICHYNGFDILGSTISFAAPATGTYYVKIESSSTRPVSAGRYGRYTLTITSP